MPDAVVLFAGPTDGEHQARDVLRELGTIRACPYRALMGETFLALTCEIQDPDDGPGRAHTATVLAHVPDWNCRGVLLEEHLGVYRRSVQ